MVILVLFLVILTHIKSFEMNYNCWLLMIIISALTAKLLFELAYGTDGSMNTAITPILVFVIFNIGSLVILLINLVHLCLYLIRVIIFYALQDSEHSSEVTTLSISYFFLLTGITIISGFVGFDLEAGQRNNFILRKKLEVSYRKGQEILSQLLPCFVRDRVQQGIRYIADEQEGDVTILFLNVCDFDSICTSYCPEELIEFLDGLWMAFDNLCDAHGITKIETVGKTYMATGGLKDSELELSRELLKKNHAVRVTEMGIDCMRRV